jgi:hypothetical protein
MRAKEVLYREGEDATDVSRPVEPPRCSKTRKEKLFELHLVARPSEPFCSLPNVFSCCDLDPDGHYEIGRDFRFNLPQSEDLSEPIAISLTHHTR